MARIRTIKPEFFTSEDVVALTPMARLLYVALWCEADREGRMAWKPRTFKIRYFPADDCNIELMCAEVLARGMAVLYGVGLAYIPKFLSHQHINPRESKSELPVPDASPRVNHASARVSDAQVGRKEGKERNTRGSRDEGFEAFWSVYPCHKARKDAEGAWSKMNPDAELQATILKAIAEQSQGEDWSKEGGRFVPHASTWLNGKRWLDETSSKPVLALVGDV
jgi:hypothetical protein